MYVTNTIVVYEGPSELDGAPLVVLLSGILKPSTNSKTGPMVQSYILRADIAPLEAIKTGADKSICGGCGHRPKRSALLQDLMERSCYVNLGHGPRAIWAAYHNGDLSRPTLAQTQDLLRHKHLRLGAYGDPAAVPIGLWSDLLVTTAGHTGYTHQWKAARFRPFQRICMASVDTLAEQVTAAAAGWSTFLVVPEGHAGPTTECLHSSAGIQCRDCGICSGTDAGVRHIYVEAHGVGKKYLTSPLEESHHHARAVPED